MADVNSDSFLEVIVCASRASSGAGRCLVREGDDSADRVGSTKLTALGASNGDHFGAVTPTAGDFNNDGGPDFVASSFERDSMTGTVYVYDGDAATLDKLNAFNYELNVALSNLGYSIVVFDVDGDTYDDLLVGAPGYDSGASNAGAVFGWSGAALDSTPEWSQVSSVAGEEFGSAIAAGRFRSAGSPVVIVVGAPAYDGAATNIGKAYVFDASANDFPSDNATAAFSYVGQNTNDALGEAMTNAHQMLTDVGDTFVIAAPQRTKGSGSSNEGGFIKLYKPNGTTLELVQTINGEDSPVLCTSGFGSSLAGVGDATSGGRHDLLVGASECDDGSTNEGKAFLIAGNTDGTTTITSWTFQVNQAEARLGSTVSALGDVTGDGVSDFAVGVPMMDNTNCSPTRTDSGRVYFFKGVASGTPSTTQTASFAPCQDDAQFGTAIAGGDFNRDGLSDIIIGAPYYDNGQDDEGRTWVYNGKLGSVETSTVRIHESNSAGAHFGAAIGAGDVDSDDYDDAVIGRSGYSNSQSQEGGFYLFRGIW